MSRKRYYVDTSLGGCRMYAETIEGAKQVADDNAMCLQRDIYITEARGRTVAIRRWIAREYDPAIDDDKDPICFEGFGFYADWEDTGVFWKAGS